MTNIDGLSSGLDTTSIINQLMQLERRPQVALTQRRDQETAARTELSEIRSDISALRTMAADLRLSTGFDRLTASSSNEEAVSVQAGSASTTGAYSFQVTSTATAASIYSTQLYASADDATGATGPSVFSSTGHGALGLSNVSGTGFADGVINFGVTQSSEAAEVKGVGIPAIPITIDGTNDSVDVEVNGFNFSVTLAHDNYESENDLFSALQAGVTAASGASAAFGVTKSSAHEISFTTRGEGSAHSLTLTGGTALGALGLTAAATATGVDGIIEVNGTATTVTDTTDEAELTLPSGGAGTITATLNGGLRVGDATTTQSTSGAGSLTELVNSLNAADLGYTAYAVDTGAGYRLQLTANETGADSTIDVDPAVFGAMGFTVLSEGTDAELTLQGENPFTIVSSDNTFENILPGVAVTVNAVTDTPVTVSTERDVETVTESVNELVTKLNEIITRIATSTSNQPDANRSVLQGNRAARRAAEELRNAFTAPMEENSFTSVGVVGIELTREGTLNFNQERFKEAFLKDPASLTDLFTSRATAGLDEDATDSFGALDRLVEIAEESTAVGEGYLYTAAQAAEQRIDDYGRQIDNFERRMEIRESTLRRTYANLEVALGGLQQQSGYLASQLGSLGTTA